jgi:hypothetical protein
MTVITDFHNRLLQINAEALQSPIPEMSKEMAQTTQALRTQYGGFSRVAEDENGIAAEVIEYLKNHQLRSYRQIKYVCFGVSSPYGTPLTRIIEHGTLFSKLLKEVVWLIPEPRKFRRCYQGLLKSYLRYSGLNTDDKNGRKNWLALREFLAQHCKALNKQKPVMEWTLALYKHRNLLSDNPCKPYGKAMLAGDLSVVEELKSRLGIDDDTWVMNELVIAQIQAAIAQTDTEFVSQVLPLVQLLEQHIGMLTIGLALLLKRYEQCAEHPEHQVLRDIALREWKSPWLEANKPMWHAQIGESATNMIKLWLTKQHIKDFFELLQADRQADTQRMEFWLQYAEAIEDFWLALGSFSFYNQQPDYKRIRNQMEGHCMLLKDSNQNNDNAFLMKIGNFVFIEFGKQNNACHIFSSNKLPFTTGQTSISGTQSGLKNTRHPGWQNRLSHRENWQQDFAYILKQYADASPINNRVNKTSYPSSTPILTPLSASNDKTPANSLSSSNSELKPIDTDWLREFCAIHNLHFVDHRHHGGAVWVRTSDNEPTISDALKNAGFKYHKYKFAWWRE